MNFYWNCVCVYGKIMTLNNSTNLNLEETYMVDFILNVLAEIADFFINFGVDKIIDKFAKKK